MAAWFSLTEWYKRIVSMGVDRNARDRVRNALNTIIVRIHAPFKPYDCSISGTVNVIIFRLIKF